MLTFWKQIFEWTKLKSLKENEEDYIYLSRMKITKEYLKELELLKQDTGCKDYKELLNLGLTLLQAYVEERKLGKQIIIQDKDVETEFTIKGLNIKESNS